VGPLEFSGVGCLGDIYQVGIGACQLNSVYGCPEAGMVERYVGIGILAKYGLVILFELHDPGIPINYSGVKKRYLLED
jgi:hypothetical protein